MAAGNDENGTTLPGLELPSAAPAPAGGPGALELAVAAQVAALESMHFIGEQHAAVVELAKVTARDVDRSQGKGAPSGRANLLRAMKEILEILPQPEAAAQNVVDEVAALLRGAPSMDDELHPDYAGSFSSSSS